MVGRAARRRLNEAAAAERRVVAPLRPERLALRLDCHAVAQDVLETDASRVWREAPLARRAPVLPPLVHIPELDATVGERVVVTPEAHQQGLNVAVAELADRAPNDGAELCRREARRLPARKPSVLVIPVVHVPPAIRSARHVAEVSLVRPGIAPTQGGGPLPSHPLPLA